VSTVESTRPGPVSTALTELCEWLTAVAATGVHAAAPAAGEPEGVYVRPVAMLPDLGGRGGNARAPLRVRMRFAVLVNLPLARAATVVDRLLAALAADERYRLVLDGDPFTERPDLWPALVLDVAVRVDVAVVPVLRVAGGLRLHDVASRTVRGRLLGPGDVPLAGMSVSAPGTRSRVDTDARGWFVLPGQPADRPVALHLTGRGLHLRVDVTPETTDPVVVHCQIEET